MTCEYKIVQRRDPALRDVVASGIEYCPKHAATDELIEALNWIQTVNNTIDLRKLERMVVVGLVYELRGKARAALRKAGAR